MPRALINGVELYYEIHGEGPTIVFAHGAAGNHLSWWQQVAYFKDSYRCVVFDYRGYGVSPDVLNGPGASAHLTDLTALLDHLNITECCLVVQAATAPVAFRLALKQPHRIRALVMADGVMSTEELIAERQRLTTLGRAGSGQMLSSGFRETQQALAFLYDQVRACNPPPVVSTPEEAQRRVRQNALTPSDLAGYSVPTLFLWGSLDSSIPPEMGRMAQQLVPGARFVEVGGSGHSVYWEKPEEFNRIVEEFLVEAGARAGTAPAAVL